MKTKILYIILTLASSFFVQARAQSVSPQKESAASFIEKIRENSNGNITIEIPDYIVEELMKDEPARKPKNELHPGINKLNGFRIQVFSDGTNQHSLEARARARGNAIVARFPKYKGQVYSFSSSPNWYTRIGNFRTQAEASQALSELKSAFPQYAGEMRVVKSPIVVIK